MINLSERLQIIAERTEKPEAMADIGTDHGFLPIYMLQSGSCRRAIVSDISGPSLSKAVENSRFYLEDDSGFEAREGDGLATIGRGEVDAVVIAGMGGRLIRDIMAADMEHTYSFKRFVLQPRIGQGYLRKWLCDNGFRIISEDIAVEGSNLPEIITAVSPDVRVESHPVSTKYRGFMSGFTGEDIQYRIPPWIVRGSGPVEEFLRMNLSREKNILKSVMMSRHRNMKQEERICNNIYYIKALMKEVRNGEE